MFTDKNYNLLSNKVYTYDEQLDRYHAPIGTIDKTKTYYVVDAIDNNENGLQAIAVTPLKNGEPDYSHITLAYAGTGDSNTSVTGKD